MNCAAGLNVSIDAARGPPWISSTSGYFFDGSKSGGSVRTPFWSNFSKV